MSTSTASEKWKSIKGFEGLYEVSNFGNVRSLPRSHRTSRGCGVQTIKGRLLKKHLNKGYYQVTLSKESKTRSKLVYQLVGNAFIGQKPKGMTVNHKNGISSDDRVSNLEYCTHQENIQHAVRMGLLDNRGVNSGTAKLTEKDILKIYRLVGLGRTRTDIAEILNVSVATVSLIARGKHWKHLYACRNKS